MISSGKGYRWNSDTRADSDPRKDSLHKLLEVLDEIESLQRYSPFLPAVRVNILRGVRSWVRSFLRFSEGDSNGLDGAKEKIDLERARLSDWWTIRRREWDR